MCSMHCQPDLRILIKNNEISINKSHLIWLLVEVDVYHQLDFVSIHLKWLLSDWGKHIVHTSVVSLLHPMSNSKRVPPNLPSLAATMIAVHPFTCINRIDTNTCLISWTKLYNKYKKKKQCMTWITGQTWNELLVKHILLWSAWTSIRTFILVQNKLKESKLVSFYLWIQNNALKNRFRTKYVKNKYDFNFELGLFERLWVMKRLPTKHATGVENVNAVKL